MNKSVILLCFVAVVCAGCGMEGVSIGACGRLGDLNRKNADCQCTAEDDDLHRGSSNQIDRSTHLELCSFFNPNIDAASQYQCVDYRCESTRCPEGYIAADDHLSCVPGKLVCNPISEVEDGSWCKCNEENGWVGDFGHCVCDESKHLVAGLGQKCLCDVQNHWVEGDDGACVCDASNDWVESGGACVCDASKYLVDVGGECACNAAKHRVDVGGECVCDASDFRIDEGGECVCDETKYRVDAGGACVCDASRHRVDVGGECICDSSRHFIEGYNGACVCDELNGYFYSESSQTCVTKNCGENSYLFDEQCVKVGDIVQFGRFPQTSADAAPEPIDWLVLEASPDELFILSKYALIPKAYNESYVDPITWEISTIRSWLNGYDASQNADKKDFSQNDGDSFIRYAFNAEERAKIKKVYVENADNPKFGTDGGNDTYDYIFLLSYQDVTNRYFFSDEERVIWGTPYDMSQGAFHYGSCTSINGYANYCPASWWLRSPGNSSSLLSAISDVVGHGGVVRSDGRMQVDDSGVRPAMYLQNRH